MIIFHGSPTPDHNPFIDRNRIGCDFGPGFYCATDFESARLRVALDDRDGFVSRYSLDTEELNVADLTAPPLTPLHWLSVLVRFRILPSRGMFAREAVRYLPAHFPVALESADVVIGPFADDSRFAYAVQFLSNTITLRQLRRALSLAGGGLQVCVKTPRALERLKLLNAVPVSRCSIGEMLSREDAAFRRACAEADAFDCRRPDFLDGLLISDIIRERIDEHDSRLK